MREEEWKRYPRIQLRCCRCEVAERNERTDLFDCPFAVCAVNRPIPERQFRGVVAIFKAVLSWFVKTSAEMASMLAFFGTVKVEDGFVFAMRNPFFRASAAFR